MTSEEKKCQLPSKPTQSVITPFTFNRLSYDEVNCHIIISSTQDDHIAFFDSNNLNKNNVKPSFILGSKGRQPGQFEFPQGICIQPFTRNLLVCDYVNHRIQIFNINNENNTIAYSFLYQIGRFDGSGTNEIGNFIYPQGICCDEKGHIIVADTSNSRIQEFDENGTYLLSFCDSFDQFNYPADICFDKEHHQCLVADPENRQISIWSHDSSSKPQLVSSIKSKNRVNLVCVDPIRNHEIIASEKNRVLIYDNRNHKLIQELGRFVNVTGLCINEDEKSLLVADFYQQINIFK